MCNMVYISTDYGEDLSKYNSDLVKFKSITDPSTTSCFSMLDFPNKWYVGSLSECSCTFRHLLPESVSLGFNEPEDWFEEEQDDIDATRELYRVIALILDNRYQLDLIDQWNDTSPHKITTINISLKHITEKEFRLFEDYKFKFKT